MKMKAALATLAIGILFTSCAHSFMRGTVAMKTDKSTAHVCLGKSDVKIGDKIDFYTSYCGDISDEGREGADYRRKCEMKLLGTGVVSKLLNSHYSEVKTDGSFMISEGNLVQIRK